MGMAEIPKIKPNHLLCANDLCVKNPEGSIN